MSTSANATILGDFSDPAFSTDQLGGCIVAVRRGVPEGSTAKSSFGDKVSKCINAGCGGSHHREQGECAARTFGR